MELLHLPVVISCGVTCSIVPPQHWFDRGRVILPVDRVRRFVELQKVEPVHECGNLQIKVVGV